MSDALDVFISYARDDRELARKIAQQVESRGMSVWWDVVSMRAGQDFEALIRRALNRVRCVVVLWTAASIHPDRRWVRAEANVALSRDVLVPALFVDPHDLPLPFNLQSGVDLRGWTGIADAAEIAQLINQVELCVRSANVSPDHLEPSVDYLRDAVHDSLEANHEIGAIIEEINHTIPSLKARAGAKALAQLDTVLDEVHATVRAVNEAVTLFLKPALTGKPIDQNPDPYLELASRDLFAVIEEGRGHCRDISNIYFGAEAVTWPLTPPQHPRSLRYWIHDNLDDATAARLDQVFLQLDESDMDLFSRMGRLGYVLSSTSKDVVRLLAHARPDDARTLVVDSIETLQPLQDELARCMQRIRYLQADVRQF